MAFWTITAALAASAAQAPPPPMLPVPDMEVSPEHAPAALDALLAARDYMTLGKRIGEVSRQPDLVSDLAWLRDRTLEGNSAFVAMLYSRLLWTAAGGLPEEPQRDWRQTAATMTLYAQAAIMVDGQRCGDRSAPANRSQQLLGWNREIWPFIGSLGAEERQRLVDLAVLLEARTAARRDAAGDVDFLCRGGMEEIQYNLVHGTSREEAPRPGVFGRQIVLEGDGKYKPSERPQAEWSGGAAKVRPTLSAGLAAMTDTVARHRSDADTGKSGQDPRR
ncbi:MAG TPA: hypothetical protein VGC35_00740 [Allosphingosinicella sp.]|jgi:hypothetical protein